MVDILGASINLNNNRTAVFIGTCQPGEKEVSNILIAILIVIKFISGYVKKNYQIYRPPILLVFKLTRESKEELSEIVNFRKVLKL
jgi:hypothetical protein